MFVWSLPLLDFSVYSNLFHKYKSTTGSPSVAPSSLSVSQSLSPPKGPKRNSSATLPPRPPRTALPRGSSAAGKADAPSPTPSAATAVPEAGDGGSADRPQPRVPLTVSVPAAVVPPTPPVASSGRHSRASSADKAAADGSEVRNALDPRKLKRKKLLSVNVVATPIEAVEVAATAGAAGAAANAGVGAGEDVLFLGLRIVLSLLLSGRAQA